MQSIRHGRCTLCSTVPGRCGRKHLQKWDVCTCWGNWQLYEQSHHINHKVNGGESCTYLNRKTSHNALGESFWSDFCFVLDVNAWYVNHPYTPQPKCKSLVPNPATLKVVDKKNIPLFYPSPLTQGRWKKNRSLGEGGDNVSLPRSIWSHSGQKPNHHAPHALLSFLDWFPFASKHLTWRHRSWRQYAGKC